MQKESNKLPQIVEDLVKTDGQLWAIIMILDELVNMRFVVAAIQ